MLKLRKVFKKLRNYGPRLEKYLYSTDLPIKIIVPLVPSITGDWVSKIFMFKGKHLGPFVTTSQHLDNSLSCTLQTVCLTIPNNSGATRR